MSDHTIERDAEEAIERICAKWNGGLSAEDEAPPRASVSIPREDIESLKSWQWVWQNERGLWVEILLQKIAEQFDLDYDQARRFVSESCNAGEFPNPEEESELVEDLRKAARHEPDVGWLLEGTEQRGA